MTRYCRATVEYDGAAYNGWQIQKNGPSIQEELEKALLRLAGEAIRVRGAGRTDAGVHARGQTAAFPLPPGVPLEKVPEALNSRLPADIAVVRAEEVDASFDPRRHCVCKQYTYCFTYGRIRTALTRGRAWHVKWPLDADAMRRAAALFLGTHDFTSFCNQERAGQDNVRTVERSELITLPSDAAGRPRHLYVVEGKSFLYNMVRTLAGTLVEVGTGRFAVAAIEGMFREKRRMAAGQSAPPWGLCLEWTMYPGDAKPRDAWDRET